MRNDVEIHPAGTHAALFDRIDRLQQQLAAAQAAHEASELREATIRVWGGKLRVALSGLVRLKEGPRDAAYEQQKPAAWAIGKAALDLVPPTPRAIAAVVEAARIYQQLHDGLGPVTLNEQALDNAEDTLLAAVRALGDYRG